MLIKVQGTLLADAAAAAADAPAAGSLELQAISAIGASLTYPQAPVKVIVIDIDQHCRDVIDAL